MIEEVEIKVQGRVQGVNFRNYIKNRADELGLKGIVMNRNDGSVEIVVQADKKILSDFIHWIEDSPGFSLVKGLSYHWKKRFNNFNSFDIVKEDSLIVDQAKSFINLGKEVLGIKGKVPIHVAIIPDGNRRWAKQRGMKAEFGHYTSASFLHMHSLFEEARKLGVKYLTLWGFSTENWKRNNLEIQAIFDMILKNVEQFREEVHSNKIRFKHIGRKDRLPKKLVTELEKLEDETKKYEQFNVQLCLDYGGRDELLRAVNLALKNGKNKILEEDFEKYLDSYGIPDLDLVIRTSGEQRTSGFMPFQSVYSELYFTDVHFPDFNAREFKKAIEEYSRRQRRYGG